MPRVMQASALRVALAGKGRREGAARNPLRRVDERDERDEH